MVGGPLQDLATQLGIALGASPSAAHATGGLLLSLAILLCVGMAFSALMGVGNRNSSTSMVMTSVILFVAMGFLYVLTWLDLTFLVIACVVIGLMFAKAARDSMTGG
jgi:glucan phosphoethanolaminetransferase (alkaline phosphatase superfamily)